MGKHTHTILDFRENRLKVVCYVIIIHVIIIDIRSTTRNLGI